MKILVTGSSGHLGEALVRRWQSEGHDLVGVDILPSPFTRAVGSIVDRAFVADQLRGVQAVVHAATLHKPHVATHTRQQFVDVNIAGTLNLLEEAARADVDRFIFTSTTSAFGDSLSPPESEPAAWITEDAPDLPKNIYGATKSAAEGLCRLFARDHHLPCLVLRTSRFFPEDDDNEAAREAFSNENLKANEFLNRRVDVDDIVTAHWIALQRAAEIGFSKYIISATTPFGREHLEALRRDAPSVVAELFPDYRAEYERRGWRMSPTLDRVYVNARAREELGWKPKYDFARALKHLARDEDPRSELARAIGAKGYHERAPAS